MKNQYVGYLLPANGQRENGKFYFRKHETTFTPCGDDYAVGIEMISETMSHPARFDKLLLRSGDVVINEIDHSTNTIVFTHRTSECFITHRFADIDKQLFSRLVQLIERHQIPRVSGTQVWLRDKKKSQMKLFPNPIDNERSFGITRELADHINKLHSAITPESARKSYRHSGNEFKEGSCALRVVDDKEEIQSVEQFVEALMRIKKGQVFQTFLALWYYANLQSNFYFNGVPLQKIMRCVLNPGPNGYFTQAQRREFTKAIHYLRDLEIFLDQTITDKDDRGRKKKVIRRDYFRLINLDWTTYAKRKKDVIDPETGKVIHKKGEADESVILRLTGELLPKFNKGKMRGRLYSKGLLELDANKDERAIFLGFWLSTRFDQLRQGQRGEVCIQVDRKTLIERAGYIKTNNEDRWLANQYLIKTLNKLIEVGVLRNFEPKIFTTDDDLRITLYPAPITSQLESGIKELDKEDKEDEDEKDKI